MLEEGSSVYPSATDTSEKFWDFADGSYLKITTDTRKRHPEIKELGADDIHSDPKTKLPHMGKVTSLILVRLVQVRPQQCTPYGYK